MGSAPETDIRPDDGNHDRETPPAAGIGGDPTIDDGEIPDLSWREHMELRAMRRTPREKEWRIPAQADKGPVRITVRVPEVHVADSAGRHILIGPEQAEILGARLIGIRDWIQNGHEDWVGDDDRADEIS